MTSKLFQYFAGYAMMGMMMDSSIGGRHVWHELTPFEKESLRRIAEHKQREIAKERGLKEFKIDGFSVMALNEKNAIRKIKNLVKELNKIR